MTTLKRTLYAALIAIFFTAPKIVEAVNFVEIVNDETNGVMAIDVDSFADRGDHIVAWVRHVPANKESMRKRYTKDAFYCLSMYAASKRYSQMQILSEVCYDKDNKVIEASSVPFTANNYDEIIPGSIGEHIYKIMLIIYRRKEASS